MGSPSQAVPMAQTGHSTADRNPYGNAPGDFPSFLLSKTIRQLSCAGNDQEGRLLQPFEHGMESIGHEFTHRVSCGDIGFGGWKRWRGFADVGGEANPELELFLEEQYSGHHSTNTGKRRFRKRQLQRRMTQALLKSRFFSRFTQRLESKWIIYAFTLFSEVDSLRSRVGVCSVLAIKVEVLS
ncbi:hypothetical protein RHMOL_Rhmol08G0105300 [Rhododendron molle]|uniref:Uncharacterized protein n=1 Tax=Rhododendron molle TaxID=49168 RepID=A0ACC0MLY8_RHOML|nr:hypothetical protein RHMOL_Rhmol08G0105300 [Rhododendron molle]